MAFSNTGFSGSPTGFYRESFKKLSYSIAEPRPSTLKRHLVAVLMVRCIVVRSLAAPERLVVARGPSSEIIKIDSKIIGMIWGNCQGYVKIFMGIL